MIAAFGRHLDDVAEAVFGARVRLVDLGLGAAGSTWLSLTNL
jgi:hypothetical protein